MPATILDGKKVSAQVEEQLIQRIANLKAQDITPGLAVILVGEDPASQTYVRNKEKACERLELYSHTVRLPGNVTQEMLETIIARENADPTIHGILVQLPLPAHLDSERALALIRPEKDVDGFHDINMGRLLRGTDGVIACTPKGIMCLLKSAGISLAGKEAVVVGRSNIVGKPMSALMLRANGTVVCCHSHTPRLAELTRQADVLVVAAGHPGLITGDMVKPGATVIDVAMNRDSVTGKFTGDVVFDEVAPRAAFITPVPGGVGPMTRAMLMRNILAAARAHLGVGG